jgi:hypothetical protein
MIKRKIHPNKEIEKAIQYAESKGWRYKKAGGSAHAWGRLLCPLQNREGCGMSIWSTPRSPDTHAKQIRKRVDSCPHEEEEQKHEKTL